MSDERVTRDRRRTPRWVVPQGEPLSLEICTAVRILDISRGGAMIAGPLHAASGSRAALYTKLDALPVTLPLEIMWSGGRGAAGTGTKGGCAFTTLDNDARQRLEAFLSREI